MTDYEYFKKTLKTAEDHTGEKGWKDGFDYKLLEYDNILFVFKSDGSFYYLTRNY